MRNLIHPERDNELYIAVLDVLENAITAHPENFDHTENKPGVVDHYGYRTDTRSLVVLSEEYGTAYMRLTLPSREHPVFDRLARMLFDHFMRG